MEFEVEVEVECPKCGHKFVTPAITEIESEERDEL